MPIFYLDSGSIDRLEISSSLLVSGSFIVSGSMTTTGGLTGSLFGTSSWSQNAVTASYVLQAVSASFATSASIAVSSSYALTSSFALSASWAPGGSGTITIQDEGSPQGSADTVNFTGAGVTATVVGNTATVNIPGGGGLSGGTTNSIPLWSSATTLTSSFIQQAGNTINTDGFVGGQKGLKLDFDNNTYQIGDYSFFAGSRLSIDATNGIISTHQYDGFSSLVNGFYIDQTNKNYIFGYSENSVYSGLNIEGGVTKLYSLGDYNNTSGSTKLVINDTTQTIFLSGSIYNSGSLTVDVGTTLDLLSAGGFTGNQNNYLELYVQNLSSGVSASTDIVAYADNASETSNFIDLGINSSGIAIGYSFGNANDGYVYNSGGNLFIGNNTAFSQPTVSEQSLFLFSNASGSPDLTITGSRVGIRKSGSLNNTLDVNGGVTVSGSMILTAGSGFTNLLASETLTAGDFVNVFSGGVRRASSDDTTKQAHGFVTASYSATNPVVVFYSGLNTNVSGLTAGARYFLSASGAESTIPPNITGRLSQELGIAISTTALLFQPGPAIIT